MPEELLALLFPLLNDGMKRTQKEQPKETSFMRTDIVQKEDSVVYKIDLPGFDKDEISISLKDGAITVHAEKAAEAEEPAEDEKYTLNERIKNCSRSYHTDLDISEENIQAAYKNGVLFITLKKPEKRKEVNIPIQ